MSDMQALVDRLAGEDEDLKKELLAYGRQRDADVALDRELNLREPEVGRDDMVKAAVVLKARGIAVEGATHDQLLDALRAVMPA